MGFTKYLAEKVVRYRVLVTDSKGKEYACIGDTTAEDSIAIEDTIRGYGAIFDAQDFAQCLIYFTDFGDEKEALAELAAMRRLLGEITLQKVKDIALTGQTATVTVAFTIGGEEGTDQMQLKKVDSRWKIVW